MTRILAEVARARKAVVALGGAAVTVAALYFDQETVAQVAAVVDVVLVYLTANAE